LKGSLCGSIWASFFNQDPHIFLFESETAKSLRNSKFPETDKSKFERDLNRNIGGSLYQKEAHIGCPDVQRLPFKGSLLLQNLIGPGYLELPF